MAGLGNAALEVLVPVRLRGQRAPAQVRRAVLVQAGRRRLAELGQEERGLELAVVSRVEGCPGDASRNEGLGGASANSKSSSLRS